MLDLHAVHAAGADGQWSVAFRYRDPRYAGRGRLLRLQSGQRPSFVHQDLILSAFAPNVP